MNLDLIPKVKELVIQEQEGEKVPWYVWYTWQLPVYNREPAN